MKEMLGYRTDEVAASLKMSLSLSFDATTLIEIAVYIVSESCHGWIQKCFDSSNSKFYPCKLAKISAVAVLQNKILVKNLKHCSLVPSLIQGRGTAYIFHRRKLLFFRPVTKLSAKSCEHKTVCP